MIKVITDRNPWFLQTTWAIPDIDLVPHEGAVEPGEKFIVWRRKLWHVYKMNRDHVPIPCGRFDNVHAALNKAAH